MPIRVVDNRSKLKKRQSYRSQRPDSENEIENRFRKYAEKNAAKETDRFTNRDKQFLEEAIFPKLDQVRNRMARQGYTGEEIENNSGMKYGGMKKKTKKMKHGGMHKKKKVMKANKGTSVDFPMDHPDTEADYKFRMKKYAEKKEKYPKMMAVTDALGLGKKKITKERSAKFLGEMARNRAARLTATEGSFKTGGMSKARGTGIAIRGTKFKGIF